MKYYTDGSFGLPNTKQPVSLNQIMNPTVIGNENPVTVPVLTGLPQSYSDYENLLGNNVDYTGLIGAPSVGGLLSGNGKYPLLNKMVNGLQNVGEGVAHDANGMTGTQMVGSLGSLLKDGYNVYNSYKQNKLATDSFNFSKKQWNTNHDNQVRTTNAQMGDRQAARVAQANAEARATGRASNVTSVKDYMDKYGVR